MKKYLLFIAILLSSIRLHAENITVYGFASQVGNFAPQPYTDVKYLDYPEDSSDALGFLGSDWYFDSNIDSGIAMLTSDDTSDKLLVDTRDPYGEGNIVFILLKGTFKYYYTVYATDINRYFNGVSSSYSNSYGSGNSYSNSGNSSYDYESMYSKWERQASNAYNSLNGRSVSPSTYTRNKKLLRDAQNQMRKVRREARANGVYIEESRWETATVGL